MIKHLKSLSPPTHIHTKEEGLLGMLMLLIVGFEWGSGEYLRQYFNTNVFLSCLLHMLMVTLFKCCIFLSICLSCVWLDEYMYAFCMSPTACKTGLQYGIEIPLHVGFNPSINTVRAVCCGIKILLCYAMQGARAAHHLSSLSCSLSHSCSRSHTDSRYGYAPDRYIAGSNP